MRRQGQGMPRIERMIIAAFTFAASVFLMSDAEAADRVRLAIQKTGTASWEIEVIKARGLDKAANLDIETTELASTEAGKIALLGGAVDMVVGDWLWAARERSLGDKLLFMPYSSALGAVMAPRIYRSMRLPTSPADPLASPADRSTRAGFCCGRRPLARGSTSPRKPGLHMARRRSSPRSLSRARRGPRSNTGISRPIFRGAASAVRSKWPISRRHSARAARWR